jgi:adenylate kinase family enzyme
MEQADHIIMLHFSPLNSLWRVIKRYFKFKGTSRPDMAKGCNEKLDFEFIKWVLFDGRKEILQQRYEDVLKRYCHKVTTIKNQKELDYFIDCIIYPFCLE